MLLEALRLACPEGLEPPTYCLEGNCSIQLSYGQMCEMETKHHTAKRNPVAQGPCLSAFRL